MRVSVIINPRAGTMKLDLVKRKIREALFRCQLKIHICNSLEGLGDFVETEIHQETSAFIICGGDGTVNATLQCMLKYKLQSAELPPICLVSSGTANDLATEIEISSQIDEAARLLLEGREKKIDLIEVQSGKVKKYMLTNGGIGIPALAACLANQFRSDIADFSEKNSNSILNRQLGKWAQKTIKKVGTLIYSASLLKVMSDWKSGDWQLEIKVPGKNAFTTSAPFILINNQPTIGKTFLTAPYTTHNDGLVNLLIIESSNVLTRLEKILRVYMGWLKESHQVKSIETSEFSVKTKNSQNKITFFGDGEVLFRDVNEVRVRCLKRSISVMVKQIDKQ